MVSWGYLKETRRQGSKKKSRGRGYEGCATEKKITVKMMYKGRGKR